MTDSVASHDVLRPDLQFIAELVPPGASVLDLGCGDGALLAHLRDEKGSVVRGVERDPASLAAALAQGLSVVQVDLDEGLAAVPDGAFDVVVLSRTLQEMRRPDFVMRELLRAGKQAIVSFPNFAHWRVRGYLLTRGRMPVSEAIPFSWYDTPNIHHATIKDFREFITEQGGRIVEEHPLRTEGWHGVHRVGFWPNLFADQVVTVISPK